MLSMLPFLDVLKGVSGFTTAALGLGLDKPWTARHRRPARNVFEHRADSTEPYGASAIRVRTLRRPR